jgi:hypothetical protein
LHSGETDTLFRFFGASVFAARPLTDRFRTPAASTWLERARLERAPRSAYASPVSPIHATLDPSLRARIRVRHALYYTRPRSDLPAFVRAASGLTWFADRLAVVQDDTLLVALVDPDTFEIEPVELPLRADGARTFDKEQGNKKFKADFEAAVSAPVDGAPTLLAFGSGSHENRESIAMLRQQAGNWQSRIVHVPALYAGLRAARGFLSSELNLEGALLIGGRLRLFQRSNGSALSADLPVCCATCDLDWPALLAHLAAPHAAPAPLPQAIRHYDLGLADDGRLTFTDAALLPDATIAFSASAENSPNAYDDGEVTGSALGKLDGERALLCPLLDERGSPVREKVEGLAFAGNFCSRADPRASTGGTQRAYVVFDPDDHRKPATLAELDLIGF